MKRYIWLVLLGLTPLAAAAQEQEREPPTISVSATASVERAPERAQLSLAVESEGETAQAASQANSAAMERVLSAIRGVGIPDDRIRTVSYRMDPVYGRRTRPDSAPTIVGYRAINMVQVTVDTISRVGGVIDAGIGSGANRVAGLSFELRDPESARLEALEQAVAKAKREADLVAQAAGQRLGPPMNISMSAEMPPPRPIFAARAMEVDVQAATPVEAGTLTVTATVNIVYRLERM